MCPTPSPLLTLPPELRNQILETLFFDAQLSTLCKCHPPNPFQRVNYGILAANKQLRREASNILFHGAVLRLDVAQEVMGDPVSLVTKTIIPVWSWYVRDRYRDQGTDLEFLQRWQGLKRVRHVKMSLPSELMLDHRESITGSELGRYLKVCEIAVEFLNGLPDVEDLTVCIDALCHPLLEMCKEELREITNAKLVLLGRDDVCGHQSGEKLEGLGK